MRVPPLPADQWDDAVDHAFSGMLSPERRNPEAAGNALATLVRHPEADAVLPPFQQLSVVLIHAAAAPARAGGAAESRTDATASTSGAITSRMGRETGLTDDVIDGIQRGEAADDLDRAILLPSTNSSDKSVVSDETWAVLSEHLDEHQRMDLVFTIGCYGASCHGYQHVWRRT